MMFLLIVAGLCSAGILVSFSLKYERMFTIAMYFTPVVFFPHVIKNTFDEGLPDRIAALTSMYGLNLLIFSIILKVFSLYSLSGVLVGLCGIGLIALTFFIITKMWRTS